MEQAPPMLAISSPANGAIVRPGQPLAVTVTSPANVAFSGVVVVGHEPIGETSLATSLPAHFSLAIPIETSSGRLALTALGTSVSGQTATVTIAVDVERESMATSVATLLPEITFGAPGEEFPIVALADFPAEQAVDVTASSKVRYSSSNRAVAVVSAQGLVTAIAEGQASITVTYADSGKRVSADIPVTVPPAVFTMTPHAFDFGSRNVGTSGSKQFTLTNSSGYLLSIVGIQVTGDFAQTNDCASLSPLAPNATCRITLTFTPTAAGPGEGEMTVENDNRTARFTLVGAGRAIK
jgi:Big-like domain-containing protein/HYDIN/CFA65/VesB family protein